MKLSHLFAAAIVTMFGASAFAQPNFPNPQTNPPTPPPAPVHPAASKGIKITKITGTVNIMKDGQVLMTLKPGDAIPEITDNKVTFAVVDGTVEVEAGGKKVSAATGSNFTVASTNGQTNVSLGAGTPVAVRTESGNNIIMTANSEIKMVTSAGKVQISMEKGNAVMTNSSGGETQTVTAGQAIMITAAPMMPAAGTPPPPGALPANAPVEPTGTPGDMATPPPGMTNGDLPVFNPPPPPSVIPTQTVTQSCEVSASTPGCI